MTPTQRSIAVLKERGFRVAICEKWVPWPKPGHRADLFGIADLICYRPGEILLVQTTSGSNLSARRKKIEDHENTVGLIAAGFRIWLHGWRKTGPRGKRKTWALREEQVYGVHEE